MCALNVVYRPTSEWCVQACQDITVDLWHVLLLSLFVHHTLHQADVEVPIPRYFLSENAKAIKEREKLLGTILAKMGPPDIKTKAGDEASMTTEDAVRLIQVHERARQGRLRAKLMKDIRYTHTHTHTHTLLVHTYINNNGTP